MSSPKSTTVLFRIPTPEDLAEKREALRRWRLANREHVQAYKKRYRAEHAEEIRASEKAYRLANQEHIQKRSKAYRQEYYRKNKAKIRAQNDLWAQMNPEKVRALARAGSARWRKNNLERAKAVERRYKENNPEKVRAKERRYWAKNPDKKRAKDTRRRARVVGAPINDFTAAQWASVKAHYKHCCAYCGKRSQRLSIDHITPLSKGGAHSLHNIIPSCRLCNSRKQAGPVLCPVQPLLLLSSGG